MASTISDLKHDLLPHVADLVREDPDLGPLIARSYERPHSPVNGLIAMTGDRVDGFIHVDRFDDHSQAFGFHRLNAPEGPHGYIHRILVRDDLRGQKLGPALLHTYVRTAAEEGITYIFASLDTSSDAHARRRFFQKTGFNAALDVYLGATPAAILAALERPDQP